MRSHSTKNQLKEKSPEAKFILSNTLHALLLFKIQKIQTSVSLCVRQLHARIHSALGTFLAALPLVRSFTRVRGAFLASVARWPALAGVFCGVGTSRGGRQGTRTAAQRRSAPPIAPLVSAWPHACQRMPVAPPPWPASTGRAPCRRRARAAPFYRTHPQSTKLQLD